MIICSWPIIQVVQLPCLNNRAEGDGLGDVVGRADSAAGDERHLVADAFIREKLCTLPMAYSMGMAMFFLAMSGAAPVPP